jgi:hypothetical protein
VPYEESIDGNPCRVLRRIADFTDQEQVPSWCASVVANIWEGECPPGSPERPVSYLKEKDNGHP